MQCPYLLHVPHVSSPGTGGILQGELAVPGLQLVCSRWYRLQSTQSVNTHSVPVLEVPGYAGRDLRAPARPRELVAWQELADRLDSGTGQTDIPRLIPEWGQGIQATSQSLNHFHIQVFVSQLTFVFNFPRASSRNSSHCVGCVGLSYGVSVWRSLKNIYQRTESFLSF